jgi:hypothetical protein
MDQRLRRCTDEGMSVLLGTVNAGGEPHCCRAIAVTAEGDLDVLTVYVPAATGQEAIANIATTRRLAVVVSHPIRHDSIQLKGTSRTVRMARDDEASLVRGRLEAFAEVLGTIGLPKRITRSVSCWPAFAVEMDVREIFDQTPGPTAGVAIR